MHRQLYRTPDGVLHARNEPGFSVGEDEDEDDDDEEVDDFLLFGEMLYGEDEYGAKHHRSKKSRSAKLKRLRAMALAKAAGGFAFPNRGDGYGMRLPLPFEQDFTAGQTVTMQLKPQNKFQVQELIFASQNAQLFNLELFKVGTEDQFVGSDGALNGDIVSSQTLRSVTFKGTIADPGIIISMRVTNLDGVNAQTLRGAIVGPAVRYGGIQA